jgi:hypothetical protein
MKKEKMRRVLTIGFEDFLVPDSLSDQKIAACISVLRELTPLDSYGEAVDDKTIKYECTNRRRLNRNETATALARLAGVPDA